MTRPDSRHLTPALVTLLVACGGTATNAVSNSLEVSNLHRMRRDGAYAVAYDARGRGAYIGNAVSGFQVCAEPSPDAAANLTVEAARQISASASATTQAVNAALGVESQTSAMGTSTLADVVDRSEIVLILRSAMYRICEMKLNGTIDAEEAASLFRGVLATIESMTYQRNISSLISILRFDPEGAADLHSQILKSVVALSYLQMASQPNINQIARSHLTSAAAAILAQTRAETEAATFRSQQNQHLLRAEEQLRHEQSRLLRAQSQVDEKIQEAAQVLGLASGVVPTDAQLGQHPGYDEASTRVESIRTRIEAIERRIEQYNDNIARSYTPPPPAEPDQ